VKEEIGSGAEAVGVMGSVAGDGVAGVATESLMGGIAGDGAAGVGAGDPMGSDIAGHITIYSVDKSAWFFSWWNFKAHVREVCSRELSELIGKTYYEGRLTTLSVLDLVRRLSVLNGLRSWFFLAGLPSGYPELSVEAQEELEVLIADFLLEKDQRKFLTFFTVTAEKFTAESLGLNP
jgi:hypothetical protein